MERQHKFIYIGYLGKVYTIVLDNQSIEQNVEIVKNKIKHYLKKLEGFWRRGGEYAKKVVNKLENIVKNPKILENELSELGIRIKFANATLGFPGDQALIASKLGVKPYLISVATKDCLKEYVSLLKSEGVDFCLGIIRDKLPYPLIDVIITSEDRRLHVEKAFILKQYLSDCVSCRLNEYINSDNPKVYVNCKECLTKILEGSTTVFLERGGFYYVPKYLQKRKGLTIVFIPGMPKDFRIINNILSKSKNRWILENHEVYVIFDIFDIAREEIYPNTNLELKPFIYDILCRLSYYPILWTRKCKFIIYSTLWDCVEKRRNVKYAWKIDSKFSIFYGKLKTNCNYFSTDGDEELFATAFIYANKVLRESIEDSLKFASATVYTKFKDGFDKLTLDNIRKNLIIFS